MARDSKKYRQLQSALKLTGGTAAPGSPAANYQEFKAGRRELNQRKTVRLSGALLQRFKVPIYPFDQPATALSGTGVTSRVVLLAYITRSSDAFRKKTAPTGAAVPAGTVYPAGDSTLSDTELGYLASTTEAQENGSFYSALLRCNYGVGVSVTRTNSGVTGRAYKARPSTLGASIPFGRDAANFATATQQKRFIFLSKELKQGLPENSTMSVSLAPEEFSDSQRDVGFIEEAT